MRKLILLSAIPGSGKSTWAKKYAHEHPNTFIIASDEVRIEIAGEAQNFDHEEEVWRVFLERINEYADRYEDCNVIADATNLQNRFRAFYAKETPKFDKHVLVVFHIPLDVCLKQNLIRPADRIVPEDAMRNMAKEFEEPNEEVYELYDEIVFVEKFSHVKPSDME